MADAKRVLNRNRLASVLMCFGALIYISVIGEAIIGWPLDVQHSYLSELAARQFPKSWAFRFTDLLSGIAIAWATVLFMKRAKPGGSQPEDPNPGWYSLRCCRRILSIGLVLFALATIVDSTLTPLDCALSLPECKQQIEAGTAGQHEWMHDVSSTIVGVGTVLVAFAFALIVLRSRDEYGRWVRIAIPSLAVSVLVLVGYLTVTELLGIGPMGLAQRAQIVLAGILIAFTPIVLRDKSIKPNP